MRCGAGPAALLGAGMGLLAWGEASAGALPAVSADFLDEGFEAQFPPAGWIQAGNPAVTGVHRWHASTQAPYVHGGATAALVQWQSTRTQDERLLTPPIDLSQASPAGLRLSFWWYTDPFWAPFADFQVQASADGSTFTTIWQTDGLPDAGWAWRRTLLDVSAYAGGNLHLLFRYKGKDGADVAFDEVRLGYLQPPQPPGNDDCAGAQGDPTFVISQVGAFSMAGDNTFATNDYPLSQPASCTGYGHTGRDVVWVVDVPPAHHVTATMTTSGGWDDTLFLVSDCQDPEGTCLSGQNALPDGSQVWWANTGPTARRVYLIASGYGGDAGPFTLTGHVQPGTAVSSVSWGSIKARYR